MRDVRASPDESLPFAFWPEQGRLRDNWEGIFWVWVAPFVAAVFLLGFVGRDLAPAWSAAHGGGTHGVLRVEDKECNRTCQSVGTFTSDDGTLVLHHVRLSTGNLRGPALGSDYRVTFQGERNPPIVYAEKGSYDWIFVVGFVTLGAVCALWCAWCAALACVRLRARGRSG